MFKSGLEEKVSDLLCELGVDYEYESVSFAYTIQHLYTPDFVLPNGVVLETKGYWRPEDRRKVRQVIAENPDIDLRMVFQDPYKKLAKNQRRPMHNGARDMELNGVHFTPYQLIGLHDRKRIYKTRTMQ